MTGDRHAIHHIVTDGGSLPIDGTATMPAGLEPSESADRGDALRAWVRTAAARLNWQEPPDGQAGGRPPVAWDDYAMWHAVRWLGPLDGVIRFGEQTTDAWIDPHGQVTVKGFRHPGTTVLHTGLHPAWCQWIAYWFASTVPAGIATLHRVGTVEGSCDVQGVTVRFTLTAPLITPEGYTVTLRTLCHQVRTLQWYVNQGLLPAEAAKDIETALNDKLPVSILVAGATGSGKTTMLTALYTTYTAQSLRVIVLQDVREIPSFPPGFSLAICEQSFRVLMRLNPERVVVGEIRGHEALLTLKAWASGHPGMATIHADGPASALANLLRMADEASEPGTKGGYRHQMLSPQSQLRLWIIWMEQRIPMQIAEVMPSSKSGDSIPPINVLWQRTAPNAPMVRVGAWRPMALREGDIYGR